MGNQESSRLSLGKKHLNAQDSQGNLSEAAEESTQRRDSVCPTPPESISLRRKLIAMAVIELNLRLPSMLHGKKGFDRIIWVFKNVLNQSLAWLFCDLESTSGNQG
jgi:hypothetical protein